MHHWPNGQIESDSCPIATTTCRDGCRCANRSPKSLQTKRPRKLRGAFFPVLKPVPD
ncbi:hypothetical protein K788_0006839 [Paraburkholderia caribensis MBA4]|uniref:Uncharacterized protein n=1 Tax=Paraburkholderia caribensis MBA4 TaxID=1323664 RepID=A0A0P0R7Q2_9BURK|nr:hypothetical protein K788_0006839 [Paraburkholderia caribensis MBA4]